MNAAWECLDQVDPGRRAQLLGRIQAFVDGHSMATMDHEPGWLSTLASDPDKEARCFVCTTDTGDVVGFAPFLVHPAVLSLELGHINLFKFRALRLALTQGPLFAEAGADAPMLCAGLFARLAQTLGPREMPCCIGMLVEGSFAGLLRAEASRWGFFPMPYGPAYRRWLITLPENADKYLAMLGASTRQCLRRDARLLEKKGPPIVLRRYCTEAEVAQFLRLAEQVSRLTYQWRLLDMGVADSAGMRRALAVAASRGWMRCYILFCGDDPIAFRLGYLHRRTYHSIHVGYDPRWSGYSPGNVLHLYSVRDLIAERPQVELLDFEYGDTPNKRSLGNASRLERHVFMLPSSFRWRLIAGIWRTGNAAIESVGRLLERYAIKSRIQRYLKRGSAAR